MSTIPVSSDLLTLFFLLVSSSSTERLGKLEEDENCFRMLKSHSLRCSKNGLQLVGYRILIKKSKAKMLN